MSGGDQFRPALIATVLALAVSIAADVGLAATSKTTVKTNSVTASSAVASFGSLWDGWTRFDAANAWYSLYTPPNWSYQKDHSSEGFDVFYGPGEADLFWVETFTVDNPVTPVALLNNLFSQYQSGDNALTDFAVLQAPHAGMLDNVPAAFAVYRYTDDKWGDTIEGLGLAVLGSQVVVVTFSDSADSFSNQVPLFNQVLMGVRVHLTNASQEQGQTKSQPPSSSNASQTVSPPNNQPVANVYKDSAGRFSLSLPEGWEMWEYQATARGDKIDTQDGVFDWPGNKSRVLFVWNGFDEVNQKPFQYEVQIVLIDGVGGTAEQAIRDLVSKADPSGLSNANEGIRVRIGNLTGMKLVFHSNLQTELARYSTIYAAKTGNTLVVVTFPKEANEAAINQVLSSFKWNG